MRALLRLLSLSLLASLAHAEPASLFIEDLTWPELGKTFLDIKIASAVAQIQSLVNAAK